MAKKKKYKSPSITKSQSVDVDIEVYLDEFDDDDIYEEAIQRGLVDISENESKVDDWKDELWQEHKHKFTLEEIEKFLTSK